MDQIVYTWVANGGGMDGRDHTDKGGEVVAAYCSLAEANKYPNKPWCTLKKEVIDLEELGKSVYAKLGPVEKLAIGIHFGQHLP